jgi:hypothetical protein
MDPGIAGSVGAALWCLVRFQQLERESPSPSRRSAPARLRSSTLGWAASGVVISGTAACFMAAFALAMMVRPDPVAAILYCALCTTVLALLLIVEALHHAYRVQSQREAAARRRRRASVRTIMRTGPPSQVPR